MACWTLEQAQDKLALWMAADEAVSKGQSYQIKDRELTRVNAREIRNNIKFWTTQCERLQNGGNGGPIVRRAIPRDFI